MGLFSTICAIVSRGEGKILVVGKKVRKEGRRNFERRKPVRSVQAQGTATRKTSRKYRREICSLVRRG